MTMKEVMEELQQELNNNRLDVLDSLSERFINGSPDQVLMTIESQFNKILDERDEILINVFTKLTEMYEELLHETIKTLSGEWYSKVCRKTEQLPTSTR